MKKLFVSVLLLFLMVELSAQNQHNPWRALNYIPENPSQLAIYNWQTIGEWIVVEELYGTLKPELKGKTKKLLTPLFNDWINNDGSTAIDFKSLCAVTNGNLYLPVTGLEPLKKMLKKMKLKGKWEIVRGEDGTIYHTYTVSNMLQMVYVDDIVVFSFLPMLSAMAGAFGEVAAEVDYEALSQIMKSLKSAQTSNFLNNKDSESFLKHLTGFDMRMVPNEADSGKYELFNPKEYLRMLQETNFAYCFHLFSGKGFAEMNGYPQPSTSAEYFEQLKQFYNEETHNDMLIHYLNPEAQCVFSNNMIPKDGKFPLEMSYKIFEFLSYIPIELLSNSFVGSVNMNKIFTLVAPLKDKNSIEAVLTKDIEFINHKVDLENALNNSEYAYEIAINDLEKPEYRFLKDSLENVVKQQRMEMLKHHARFQEENKNSNLIDTLYEDYMFFKLKFDSDDSQTSFKVSQYDISFDDNYNTMYLQQPILYITVKEDVIIISNEDVSKIERTDDLSVAQKKVLDNIHLPFFLAFGEMGALRVDEKSNINLRFEMDTEGKNFLHYLLTR